MRLRPNNDDKKRSLPVIQPKMPEDNRPEYPRSKYTRSKDTS